VPIGVAAALAVVVALAADLGRCRDEYGEVDQVGQFGAGRVDAVQDDHIGRLAGHQFGG
jgi:hypothetical protein